jgi:cytidyltransferase-like protein|tara:strand:+ start:249 stop:686 length:438 start_codon:yes stop_codon:yes gene_type:complete
MIEKVIIVSGYFNPLHKGHIDYFRLAKAKGDRLYVIVNNDYQRELKGAKKFLLQEERVLLISELRLVDKVYLSIDKDRTVIKTIEKIYYENQDKFKFYFANGGDQLINNIPETRICKDLGITLIDRLGDKIQSSSWILNSNNENK